MISRPSSPITITISNPTPTYDAIPKARPSSHISLRSPSLSPIYPSLPSYNTLLARHIFITPFTLLPIFLAAALLWALPDQTPDDDPMIHWSAFVVGSLGWSATYMLRRPIAFLLLHMTPFSPALGAVLTLISAGFLSELGRLATLTLHTHPSTTPALLFHPTYSHGLGWSAAESIYFVIQNFFLIRAAYQDPFSSSAKNVRADLSEILGTKFEDLSVWWGVMWRGSAVLMHVGCGLCVRAHHGLVWVLGGLLAAEFVVLGECLDFLGVPGAAWGTLIIGMGVYFLGLAFFGEII